MHIIPRYTKFWINSSLEVALLVQKYFFTSLTVGFSVDSTKKFIDFAAGLLYQRYYLNWLSAKLCGDTGLVHPLV